MEKEFFVDDRNIIPERIKAMTPEERYAEIERLEKEGAREKQAILNRSKK